MRGIINSIFSMKTFALAIVLVFSVGVSVAFAHAPTLSIDPVDALEYATFPQVYDVTGSIAHNPLSALQNLTLRVNGTVESLITVPYPESAATTSAFALPWNITGPGTYVLSVTARHGTTGSTGTSSDAIVEVSETIVIPPPTEEPPVVVAECPAAPAVAAEYLREEGIRSGSKLYKNVVSLVAKHMSPKTDFDGHTACEGTYGEAVKAFVNAHLQILK